MFYLQSRLELPILWVITAIVFCLHETYDVTNIIYGIDVESENATGSVPPIEHALRLTFETGSMLIAVLILYMDSKWFRLTILIWLGVSVPANILHLAEIIKEDVLNCSQIGILSLVILVSSLLFFDTRRLYKKEV